MQAYRVEAVAKVLILVALNAGMFLGAVWAGRDD